MRKGEKGKEKKRNYKKKKGNEKKENKRKNGKTRRKNIRDEENRALRESKKKGKGLQFPVFRRSEVVSPRIKVGLLYESYK